MVPGVCEMEWKQPGRFVPRIPHLETPDSIVCLLSDTNGLKKGSTMIAIREPRGLTSSTSAFVPSAILVMSFPFEGLITLANGSDNEQCGGRHIYSIVLPSLPGRNLPPMKIPVGILVLPFQEGVSKVYSKRSLPMVGIIERGFRVGLNLSQMTRGYMPTCRNWILISPDHEDGDPGNQLCSERDPNLPWIS